MKKSTSQWMVVLFAAMTLFSCKDAAVTSNEEVTTDDAKVAYSAISNEDLETAVIYKANVTEYSEAGTFNEFTKGIPKLKKLGVKVIWLMPVFSVSEKNGNPYAVNSYEKVNPDLGTDEDLDLLIQTAHDNGMFII